MKLVDIDNEKGRLARDTQSLAIIAIDKNLPSKDAAIKNKLKKQQELESTINNLKSEVSSIKSDISKILQLLNSRGS